IAANRMSTTLHQWNAVSDQPAAPAPGARRPGESPRAFAAFGAYRDLGPRRSLRAACRQYYGGETKAKLGQLEGWSSKWNWVARAAAWDDEQDRVAREAQLETIKEMNRRHAEEAVELQQKALERLKAMNPEELKASEVLDYLVQAAKLERLARGES